MDKQMPVTRHYSWAVEDRIRVAVVEHLSQTILFDAIIKTRGLDLNDLPVRYAPGIDAYYIYVADQGWMTFSSELCGGSPNVHRKAAEAKRMLFRFKTVAYAMFLVFLAVIIYG